MSKQDLIKKGSLAAVAIGTVIYIIAIFVKDEGELLENLGMFLFALGLLAYSYDEMTNKKGKEKE